jgi:Zn-dependent protease
MGAVAPVPNVVAMTRVASFPVMGVEIRVDASWVLLALLIAWSLAAGVFPELYAGLPSLSYWLMALATVAGVAASIILHELGHTLVARQFGIPVKSITLFIFGGVAQLGGRPRAALGELLMAIAGPLVSIVLAALFVALAGIQTLSIELHGILDYLGTLNLALAVFNLLPAFPMDGGRVLRSLIWLGTKDVLKATRIAARTGDVIGILMMVLGGFFALFVSLVGGLWWLLIGWFVRSMARSELYSAEAREVLSGVMVADLMTPNPVTAPADMTVEAFVEQLLALRPHDLIPIVADGSVVGGVGFKQVSAVPPNRWASMTLADICTPVADIPTAEPGLGVAEAFERMMAASASRLLVMENGELRGILTLKDLARQVFLRTRLSERSRTHASSGGHPAWRAPLA